jgi:hypothetical protein
MQRHGQVAVALALLLAAPAARAVPIVSVDADPGLPGVQDTRSVVEGERFDVDVVISGIEAGAALHAYELDLDFDPALLAAVALVDTAFLGASTFTLESDLLAPDFNFAQTIVGQAGVVADGVLLTLRFDATHAGESLLDLNDVLLSAPRGVPIALAGIADARIVVRPVPEPRGTRLFLAGSALVALALTRLQRRPGRKKIASR